MRLTRRHLLAAAATCAARPAGAQPVPTVATYPVFDAPPASHRLSRMDVEADGRGYRIFRAIPDGPAPEAGWPSLWMLDGNAVFDRLGADLLAAHPGLAVIGVGYPVATRFAGPSRALDYTPATPEPRADPRHPERETGGAAAFRARLLGPLRRAAEAGVALDPARRSLWGHSYGGLFTLATLLAAPSAFRAWIPVSPSVGFGGGVLAGLAAKAAPVPGEPARVLLMLGDREHRGDAPPPAPRRPAPATMALAERLAARPDLALTVSVLQGLGHGATFAASFPAAFALAGGTRLHRVSDPAPTRP